MKLKITLLFFAIIFSSASYSQPATWEHNYGGTGVQAAFASTVTSDGGYIGAGYTDTYGAGGNDVYIVKSDAGGRMVWQRVIGGSGDDIAYGVVQNTNGEFYVCGKTNSFGAGSYDVYLIKLDASGNIIWTNTYGGVQSDSARGIVLTSAGDVVMAGGTSSSGAGSSDVYLLKVNAAGILQWAKTFGTTGIDAANGISNVNDGGFIVCGKTNGFSSNRGYAVRTNSNGDSLWTRAFNIGTSTTAELRGVSQLTSLTDFIFCGSGSTGFSSNVLVHLKTNLSGTVVYTMYGFDTSRGYGITATADGGYAVIGFINQYPTSAGDRIYVTKYNALGILDWAKNFQAPVDIVCNFSTYSLGYSITQTADQGFLLGGQTDMTSTTEMILIKTNSVGTGQVYPPIIISSNGPPTNCAVIGLTLSVPAGYTTYQWKLCSNNLTSTTNTYVPTSPSSYFCVMTDNDGIYISNLITINPITTASITPAGPLTFNCSAVNQVLTANTIAGATYQWNLNGLPIPGATATAFASTSVITYTATTGGVYTVTVSSICGTATSNAVTINATSNPPAVPVIGFNGGYFVTVCNIYSCNGMVGNLFVSNSPPPPVSYQWYFNNSPIAGATLSTYAAPTVSPGSYSVVATTSCGTASSTSVFVNISTFCPSVQATPSSGCGAPSVQLSAPFSIAGIYQWYFNNVAITGATSQIYNATLSGSYKASYSYPCVMAPNLFPAIQPSTPPFTVTINPSLATITASGSPVVCFGTVTLTASQAGATYQWSGNGVPITGATSQSYVATNTANYTCVITTSGCGSFTSNQIGVSLGIPISSISYPFGPICSGASAVINFIHPISGWSYQWRKDGVDIPGATSTSYSATLAGVYDCIATNSCGSDTSNTQTITVTPLPNASITPSGNVSMCTGGNTLLTAFTAPGYTFQWKKNNVNISGATSSSYTATTVGSYTVVSSANSCSATSPPTVITSVSFPPSNIWASTPAQFCAPGSVQLNTNTGSGYAFQWYLNNSAIPGATANSYNAVSAGSYTAAVTNASGCTTTSSAFAVTSSTINNLSINAGGPTTFCQGDSVLLSSSLPALSYQWSLNSTPIPSAVSSSIYANSTGLYSLQITTSAGCTGTAAIAVLVNSAPPPTITASGPTTFCAPGTVTLNAATGPGLTYQWRLNSVNITGATASTRIVTATGNYDCIVTNNCGSVISNVITVTVNPAPTAVITAAGPTTFCAPGSVMLNANTGPGLSYQWRLNGGNIAGATASSYTATAGGNYDCIVSSSCGSATSNVIAVTVNPVPVASITAAGPTAFCSPGSVTLNANTGPGLSYQWRVNSAPILGATSSSYIATAAGNYDCIVTNSCGSTTSNTITVTINSAPPAVITAAGPTTYCAPGSVTLNANTGPGLSYQWRLNGVGITGEVSSSYLAFAAGNYDCIVSNSCGNTASNIITVVEDVLPMATATAAGPVTFCAPGSVTLNVSTCTGCTYQWRNNTGNIPGATSPSYSATASNDYGCLVTNTCGTRTSNGITVTVDVAPTASITAAGPTSFCSPGSVTLNANAGAGLSYQWRLNGGNIPGATALSYNATAAGNYDCIVSNTCGNLASNVISVTVNPLPNAVITAAGPTSVCSPNSVTLNANTGAGLSYQWRLNTVNISGATTSSYNATATGNYSCVVSNSCGSATSNTIAVTVAALPATPGAITGQATGVCSSTRTYSISAVSGATGYTWTVPAGATISSGQGTTSVNVTFTGSFGSGNVSVVATNTCGSSGASSLAVTGIPAQPGTITGPVSVCHNQNNVLYNIAAVTGATSYTWTVPAGTQIKNGQGTTQIRVRFGNSAGNITVRANNACGQSPVRTLVIAMPCREPEDISSSDFDVTLYPNPATNQITIYDVRFTIEKIEIFDAVGQRVFSQKPAASSQQLIIDVSSFAPGIYFAEIISGEYRKVLKFIKQE